MKKYIFLCITLLPLIFLGCIANSNEPSENYSVSGNLIYEGAPLPNATISLDNRVDLTAQSNSNGEFSIKNVPRGDYTITAEKSNPDGSFLEKSSEISVTQDITIESFILPKGVKLLDPTEINATSMQLIWNATNANDFREYKLYKHTSSGLDETT